MEEIIPDTDAKKAAYLRAVAVQKQLQKIGINSKGIAKSQKNVLKLGRAFARELIMQMESVPVKESLMRKFASGERYTLEYITVIGQIIIYSHPQNPAVRPKIEVHHIEYGFIAWWNEDEFCEDEYYADLWNKLCLRGKFDPGDTSMVITAAERLRRLTAPN